MNLIKVTKIDDDGGVLFDGKLGPNEVRYLLEHGINFVLQTGAEFIEGVYDEDDDDEDEIIDEALMLPTSDTIQ